jgi:UDPglucose 6-dehydrogenase
MKIAVIGTGYVGLVSGVCFAETGVNTICVDIQEEKVQQLKNGEVPIYEPTLDILLKRNIKEERIIFTTNLKEAVQQATIIFLALPTPESEDGSADLSYVLNMANELSQIITDYKIIVNKSTVPVGTAAKVQAIFDKKCTTKVDVVSNPEFLREGYAVEDFLKPDRIVIGSSSEQAITLMKKLYAPFVRQGNPVIIMDEKSAEMTKYAANSFLALKISFMNEMANLAEKVGADINDIRKGIGTDNRIGNRFLFPGIGYGGSCFPKDVKALQSISKEYDYDFKIVNAVIDVNQKQRELFFQRMQAKIDLQGKKIAIWGLAFKPNTDDIREAPALYLIDELLKYETKIHVYDPEAMENVAKKYSQKINFGGNMYEILENADALIIVTEWNTFRTPDFNKMKSLMKSPCIFDGRNLFELQDIEEEGFEYYSIGRKEIKND